MDGHVKESLRRGSVKGSVDKEDVLSPKGEYIRFVSFFGLAQLLVGVMGCRSTMRRVKCLGSVVHKGVVPSMCRVRGCPSDDWVQVRSQVDDMKFVLARLFEAVGQPQYIWTIDFTMSSQLWAKVPKLNLGRFRQIAFETMQEYFDEVWGFPVVIGMDAVVQYWSSAEPGSRYKPHVHAVVPRIFVEKSTGRVLSDVRMKWLDQDVVKTIWRRRVEAEYGKSTVKVAGSQSKFSVKVNYIEKSGSLNGAGLDKRLRYMYRGIAWDYNVYVVNGLDYSEWDRDWVRWSLSHNHKRHQSYGLLAARNISPKSSFMRRLGCDLGTKSERDKVRRHRECPHCKAEVVVDHDAGEDAQDLTRLEAHQAGMEVWKSLYVDENVRYRDFVPYNEEPST